MFRTIEFEQLIIFIHSYLFIYFNFNILNFRQTNKRIIVKFFKYVL